MPLPATVEPDALLPADVDALVRWMTERNRGRAADAQVGFYGLDLYNMAGATRAVIDYLDRVDPEAARVARDRYGCLTPWRDDPARYGRKAWTQGYAECEEKVVANDIFRERVTLRARNRQRMQGPRRRHLGRHRVEQRAHGAARARGLARRCHRNASTAAGRSCRGAG